MLDKERLIKAPTITAEEVAEDDYVLIDSPTLGTRKIAAENFIPPKLDLYRWDFTKSLVDEVQGVEAILYKCERDENGIYVDGTSNDITFTNVAFEIGKTYEFKFGNMQYKAGQTLISFSNDSFNNNSPFSWSSGSKVWGINQDGWKASNVKVKEFPNSTLKLVILSDRIDIYQDNTKLGYITIVLNSYISFRVGNRFSGTFRNFYLEAIRIYANEEE
jgi:hypothetical protein